MQQASTQPTRPAPAKAPAAPAPAEPAQEAAPATSQKTGTLELNALQLKRGEIQDQLRTLAGRRKELLEQSYQMREGERGAHNERIRLIDQRSANLERELYRVDDQIARALTGGVQTAVAETPRPVTTTETRAFADRDQMRRDINNAVEDAVVGTMAATGTFLLGVFVVWKGFRRWIWKRKPAPAVAADQSVQIAQLQRSVDVIAVEVERISEAQRYAAKLLNDRSLGAGEAQPAKTRARDAVGAEFDQR